MPVSKRALTAIAVIIAAAIGAEAVLRIQDVRDLRQTIQTLSVKLDTAERSAQQATATATQALDQANRANQAAAQAKTAVERILSAQTPPAPPTNASTIAAGRDLAMQVCAVCHIVSPDQTFAPARHPPAPDFPGLANRPGTSEASLRQFLSAPHGKMSDPALMDQQITDVTAYLLSLQAHR